MYLDAHRCNRGSAARWPSRKWLWTLIRRKACTGNITTSAAKPPLAAVRQKEAVVAAIKDTFKRKPQKSNVTHQAS